MNIFDLRQGLGKFHNYEAFKFPGGELHIKLPQATIEYMRIQQSLNAQIITRLASSDDVILLILFVDMLKKDRAIDIEVVIRYMPYQQADRDFGQGESFSLNTICKLLGTLDVQKFTIFDPHSDVSAALLSAMGSRVEIIDNSAFVLWALNSTMSIANERIIILSPDAGAFKKIGKLVSKIGFEGEVETAVKNRNIKDGSLSSTNVYRNDFNKKNVVIIDDICVGGRTFIELANVLKDKNIGNLYLIVSHGIFSNGFKDLKVPFSGIYTTDSWQSKKDITSLAQREWENESDHIVSVNIFEF